MSLVLIAMSATACFRSGDDSLTKDGDPDAQTPASLIDHELWQPTAEADDALADHRPEVVNCSPRAWDQEGMGIELDTRACNYISLSQPLRIDLAKGDTIAISVWWASLASLEPAQGHLAVILDGRVIWQELVAIPGPADVRDEEVVLSQAAAAGASVTLHLHNHGYNTWRFQELSLLNTR